MPAAPEPHSAFAALGSTPFVALTTFRKSGEPVVTTVWVAAVPDPAGPVLVVTTPAESGKVKRLRRDPRVQLQPCGRRGAIEDGAPVFAGVAEVVDDVLVAAEPFAAIRRKYGREFTVTMMIERVFARRQKARVILRIRPAD